MISIRIPSAQVASTSTSTTAPASRPFSELIHQPAPADSSPAPFNADLIQSQNDAYALLKIQIAMQKENQLFTMISNILKTRHETAKSIIANIR